jgi:hypothetical protein
MVKHYYNTQQAQQSAYAGWPSQVKPTPILSISSQSACLALFDARSGCAAGVQPAQGPACAGAAGSAGEADVEAIAAPPGRGHVLRGRAAAVMVTHGGGRGLIRCAWWEGAVLGRHRGPLLELDEQQCSCMLAARKVSSGGVS